MCSKCGKNPEVWASGFCDPCKQAEEDERKALVKLFEAQLAFMRRHVDADSFSYDIDGTLTQVVYLSPMQKAKLAASGQ